MFPINQVEMRILLDENLPRPLKGYFSKDFEILTVHELGWQSKQNGELIKAMQEVGIGVLLTADRNLQHQQNISKYPIKLVVLITVDNRLKTIIGKIDIIEQKLRDELKSTNILEIDIR